MRAITSFTFLLVRFSMYVEEGTIKVFNLAEAEDDPAGDTNPEISCVEQMIVDLDRVM